MGRILGRKKPCDDCGSSDARQEYEEEGGRISSFCFSCSKNIYNVNGGDYVADDEDDWGEDESSPTSTKEFDRYPYGTDEFRRVTREVAEVFGVRYSTSPTGGRADIHYPYQGSNGSTSWKIRKKPKDFRVVGGLSGVQLFGQHLFPSGGRQVVITEGEEDTLAVAQAFKSHYGKIYPVVGLPSATNFKPVAENLEWLQGFDKVVLWMDNDEAGEKAKQKLAKIIGYGKCKIVASNVKDASDLLQDNQPKEINIAIWNATQYNPQGILGKTELWQKVVDYNAQVSIPYPACFQGLNDKVKGMRMGEISLFTSGTGAGKSTMLREVADHLLLNTEDKIGIISLEESPAETAKKMAALRLNKNSSAEEIPLEELHGAFEEVFGDDRVLVLDHQGAITESITEQLNYMASVGCKYLFIDHITILVSEGAEGLTGLEAVDKVMNNLLKIAKTHGVWIGLISHLRKTGEGKSFEQGKLPSLDDIRGSGSIKQISMDVIAFARNSEEGDNTISMRVLKCRHTGLTGNAGSVVYDNTTGRLNYGGVSETDGF